MSLLLPNLRNRDRVQLVEPGRLHPSAAFTRSTTATYMGPGGVLATAAVNEPRFEYSAAGVYLGYLAEEARTNLALRSQDWTNAAWVKGNLTAALGQTAPDGSTNGSLITVTASGVGTTVSQVVAATATATTMTYSTYVKAGTRTLPGIFLLRNTTTATNFTQGSFTYGTGVITGAGWVSTSIGGGWYRLTYTQSTGITVGDALTIYSGAIGGTNFTAGETWIVWGAQLEAGAFATSYIPTAGATVTRAIDAASITTLANIRFNNSAGTIYIEGTAAPGIGASNVPSVTLNDGTANEQIVLRRLASSTTRDALVTDGGVDQFDSAGFTVANSAAFKEIISWSANNFAHCVNGGTVQTDVSGTLPTVDRLIIGAFNGRIKRMWYSPKIYAAAEQVSLTS